MKLPINGSLESFFRVLAAKIELRIILASFIVFFALLAFIELSDEVMEGDTKSLDEMALGLIWKQDSIRPIGPEWLLDMIRDVTSLGGLFVLSFFILVTVGLLWLNHKKHFIFFLLFSSIGGMIMNYVLKLFFDRSRPESHVLKISYTTSSSFPSGHSMMSTTVYLTLGILLTTVLRKNSSKIYVLSIAFFLAFIIGLSRIYLGVHYPTDVLAGWLVGLSWALVSWILARWLQRQGKIESRPID